MRIRLTLGFLGFRVWAASALNLCKPVIVAASALTVSHSRERRQNIVEAYKLRHVLRILTRENRTCCLTYCLARSCTKSGQHDIIVWNLTREEREWPVYEAHIRLDVELGIEFGDILRRVGEVHLDPEEDAREDVHAQRCDHEQAADLEDGGSEIHDGVVFDYPAPPHAQQLHFSGHAQRIHFSG
jgi:hypothetical protein